MHMQQQQTVAKRFDFIGNGVHLNERTAMSILPAQSNYGIRFQRLDLDDKPVICATPNNISNTQLASSIGTADFQILTVEHLMSALWGMGIDNALILLDGEEVPIFDGSASTFVETLNAVGVKSCGVPRIYLKINEEIKVRHDEQKVSLLPYDGFKVSYRFDHPDPVFDQYPKYAEVDFNTDSYDVHVAKARSFGLESELAEAQAVKRCLGSSLENAVGLNESGVMNAEGLRYNDEFARHKILDAIGDLYLLGLHIIGEFRGEKSGHTLNSQLTQAVLRCPEKWELINSDKDEWGLLQEIA
ncbi:MAG: UDP-3-O-acyl-N-acetylglucosamine deacetylase [Gammaproteobacteria bacterium]|nr:UDP-3-O-acyl-N-acetylglucosamine deacetylase [Gammaproteobacteria bacterium]